MKKRERRLGANQEEALIALLEADLAEQARSQLLGFTLWTKPDYEVNFHHLVLCRRLDQFARGEIKRLMVFMPPRHGKSELVSRRFPAFLLGMRPDRRIVGASYADSLASAMNRDVQRIMETPEYSFLFPNSRLGPVHRPITGALRSSGAFELLGQKGGYKSVGIGTGLTGHGMDVGIIDDPVKDQQEADSLTYRERLWNWYTSTFYTRLEKDGQICITMTRWHEDDLCGRLLRLEKSDPTADKWVIVNLPALREESTDPEDPRQIGEPLWPSKYSLEKMMLMRSSMGSRVWNALYQQRPAPEGGGLVKREWLKFYKTIPSDALMKGEYLQSWDLSFKSSETSDFVVGQCWVKYGADKYLIDQIRGRFSFTETIQAFKTFTAKHPRAHVKLVEDKANGPALIDALKREIPGIIPVQVNDTKQARLNAVAPDFEAGNVHLPDPTIAQWIHDYIEELVGFPTRANDDQVDSTTQALLRLRGKAADDFSDKMVPKSNKTIASIRGGPQW